MTGALRVLEGQLVAYRRTWRGSVITTFINPVLFLSAMGLGLGSLVDRGARLGSLSYLAFYASGLLAAQAMQTGVGDAAFPVMAGFKWSKTYHTALATPIAIRDLVFGHATFILLRVTLAAVAFALVAAIFGAFAVTAALTAVPVVVLCGLAYALPVMAFTASREHESALIAVFRFGLVPMFLLSGTFFPLDQLPGWLQAMATLVPLWHAIELVRALTLDAASALPWAAHVGYLTLWLVVGALLAPRMFRRRLVA
ncbi:MAG: ABC transporter permease [Actinobacteria bacterium]|nr:ABC transporter permease [Actinomycetota bacterium]